jgi:hypothetical protein
VAVVGVLAEADVGHHDEVWVGVLDRARGELHDPFVVVGAGALGVLGVGDAEQQDGGQAQRGGLAGLLDGARDRQAVDARQRRDRGAAGARGLHEQRQDHVGRAQPRLADEVAQDRRRSQSPQAGGGKGHARRVPAVGRHLLVERAGAREIQRCLR